MPTGAVLVQTAVFHVKHPRRGGRNLRRVLDLRARERGWRTLLPSPGASCPAPEILWRKPHSRVVYGSFGTRDDAPASRRGARGSVGVLRCTTRGHAPRPARRRDRGGIADLGVPSLPSCDRGRESEGWGREDHHGGQSRCLPGGVGLSHPGRRSGSPGQRVDWSRDQRASPGGLDVRRPAGGHATGGLRRGKLGTQSVRRPRQPRSRRGGDRAGPRLQSRAEASQCARPRCTTSTTSC